MHISDAGVRRIAGFEGFSSRPYWDPYGRVWTRGFGETEGIGPHSPSISYTAGLARLRMLVEQRYEWAIRELGVELTQERWDALCSTVYNLGAGIIGRGTQLGSLLRERNWHGYANALLGYDHAGGVVLAGLRTRRQQEARPFFAVAQHRPAGPDLGVLMPAELRLARTLIAYSKHPRRHPHGLRVTREALVAARKTIWLAVHAEVRAHRRSEHAAWQFRSRAARYRVLWHLTGGSRG